MDCVERCLTLIISLSTVLLVSVQIDKKNLMSRLASATQNCACLAVSLVLCVFFALSLPATVQAQDDRERGSVSFGAFITDRRTSTRLDSAQGPGTDIDLEADLGLEPSLTVARLGGYFWLTPRQRLDFSVFDLSRTSSKTIEETIEFGDEVFNISTVVGTKSDLTILKAAYTFTPINRERGYLGFTGGLYVASTRLTLSEATLGRAESEDLTAPLPVIGLRGEYAITDRITLRGAGEWFRIDTGDVSGRLSDLYVGADYKFSKRMAAGLAYNDVSMSIEASESGGFEGTLDWSYDGFLLYFKYDFLGAR